MTTITEILARCVELEATMSEKGFTVPEVGIHLRTHGRITVALDCSCTSPIKFDGDRSYAFAYGDTIEEAFEKAELCIEDIVDVETQNKKSYTKKLADAIDFGMEVGIERAFIEPVRETKNLVLETLITKQ